MGWRIAKRHRVLLVISAVAGLGIAESGCATRRIRIESDRPAEVAVVDWADLSAPGEPKGATPIELDVSAVGVNAIRVTAKDAQPYIVALVSSAGELTVARFKMMAAPAAVVAGAPTPGDDNVAFRHVMRAYQSLARGQLDVTIQLADQLATLKPAAAAPHVLKGMALLQSGKSAEARLAFERAKLLDPADSRIDELMQASQ